MHCTQKILRIKKQFPVTLLQVMKEYFGTYEASACLSYRHQQVKSENITTNNADKIPLSVDTHIPRRSDTDTVNRVTPPSNQGAVTATNGFISGVTQCKDIDDVIADLCEGMKDFITWKHNKKKTESQRPHPVKQQLLKNFKDVCLREMLLQKYPRLKVALCGLAVEDYPVSVRLFLLSLCATLCGLPERYRVPDSWGLVSTVWSSDVSRDRLAAACQSAIPDFLSLHSKKMGNEPTKALFLRRCKSFLEQTENESHHHAFCEFLKTAYVKQPLLSSIFDIHRLSPRLANWDVETKLFLFAMMTLISDGTTKHPGTATVQQFIVGCSTRNPLANLNAATLIAEVHECIPEVPAVIEEEPSPISESQLQMEAALEENRRRIQIAHEVLCEQAALDPKEMDTEFQQLVVDTMSNQATLHPKDRNPKFQQFFHNIAHQVLQEEKVDHVSIVSVDKGYGKHEVDYAHLPRPRKNTKYSELTGSRKIQNRHLLQAIVVHQAGTNIEYQQELVSSCAATLELVTHGKGEWHFSMEEVSAMRTFLKCSANHILKIAQFEKHVKGGKLSRFPAQIKKRLAVVEKRSAVDNISELVPLKMNAKGHMQYHVFLHRKEPWLIGQHQVQGTFLAGTFEDSATFSSKKNKLVCVFGGDKDEGQTTMMQRIANRRHGNCSEYVMPLAYYEQAAECYENMSITFLQGGCPTRNYLQLLVNNGLFMLCVSVTDGESEKIIDSQCVFLNLFHGGDADKMLPEVELNLQRNEDILCSRELHKLACTHKGIDCIGLDLWHEKFWNKGIRFISLVLVWDTENENVGEYHGFCLYLGWRDDAGVEHVDTDPFSRGTFEKPLRRGNPSLTACKFLQAVGIMSCDKKHSWIISGMNDSWNQHCNCICCTQEHADYKGNPSDRLLKNGPDDPNFQKEVPGMKDYPPRRGDFSNKQMYEKWERETNGRVLTDDQLKLLKIECRSVVRAPLLHVDPSKLQLGGLHVSSGVINHFKDRLDDWLLELDNEVSPGETSWIQEVEQTKMECERLLDDNRAYKKLRKKCLKIAKEIFLLQDMIRQSENPTPYTRRKLAQLEASPELVACKAEEHLRNGAQFFKERIDAYMKSKKAKGKAQHNFRVAIQCTGCTYQKQHGGMQLSNADGVSLLEQWNWVIKTVSEAYEPGSDRQREVRKLMIESKSIADPLFEVAKLMKSQCKWTPRMLEDYDKQAAAVFSHWRGLFPDKNVFPKLHDMVQHVPEFISEHGMYGRCSEESLEGYHVKHKQEFGNLKSMKDPALRTDVGDRRLQIGNDPRQEALLAMVKAGVEGPKRGSYNGEPKRNQSIIIRKSARSAIDGIVEVGRGMTIKESWIVVYRMAVASEVPDSWNQNISKRDDLDDRQKAEARYAF